MHPDEKFLNPVIKTKKTREEKGENDVFKTRLCVHQKKFGRSI
jgi:hypothetical protein